MTVDLVTGSADLERASPSRFIRHRRHASDQQVHSSLLPPLKEAGLSQKVAALSISPMEPRVRPAEKWPLLRPGHARSFSDYTQSKSAFRRLLPSSETYHRRAISSHTASDFMSSRNPPPPNLSASSSTSTTSRMPITPTTTDHDSSQDGDSDKEQDDADYNSSRNNDRTGNRFKCTFCQKAFSRPSSLRIHIYSHTGERPFVCSEPTCGRKFSVQSNLRRHLKIHSKNRTPRYAKKQYMAGGRTVPPIAPAS